MKKKMKPKVLVAEDNIDHLELLTDALSLENIVVGTDSKEGCLEYLEKERFDLVVLDYNLKKRFSGFDILREITLKYPYLPVIMVTAYGNEELAVKVMKIGAKDYIRKTLDNNYIDRIVANVHSLIKRREKDGYENMKKDFLLALEKKKDMFIRKWKERITFEKDRFNIFADFVFSDKLLYELYSAFLLDLKDEKINDTMKLLKETITNQPNKEKFLLDIELLNITFREIAYEILLEIFPDFFDYGSTIMDQINWIVDANDIVLRKEYEKVIDKSVDHVRSIEHYSANIALIKELKDKLNEPLKIIEKNTKSITLEKQDMPKDDIIQIINQCDKIRGIFNDKENENKKELGEIREKEAGT